MLPAVGIVYRKTIGHPFGSSELFARRVLHLRNPGEHSEEERFCGGRCLSNPEATRGLIGLFQFSALGKTSVTLNP
jgi:hypothetical protein